MDQCSDLKMLLSFCMATGVNKGCARLRQGNFSVDHLDG